jgi:hypothetical protein
MGVVRQYWVVMHRRLGLGRLSMRRSRSAVTCWALFAWTLCIGLSGCVERRMTVRSNPPGAILYVDDYEIGPTPISTNFTYYGTRKFRLVKDGYETLTVMQPIAPPWYEYFPADFVAENCVPGQIRDQRMLDFQMKPQMQMPPDQLIARAEELRRSAHGSPAVPGGAIPPGIPGSPNEFGNALPGPNAVPSPGTDPYLGPSYPSPTPPQPDNPGAIPSFNGVGGQPLHPLPNGR